MTPLWVTCMTGFILKCPHVHRCAILAMHTERQVSFASRHAVSHWLLEHGCNVLCLWATVITGRDICKIF
jgi:hypothetical protein